jgi:hypothetical protein
VSYIEDLKATIHRLHGVKATHLESVPIKEAFQGKTVWDGIVEVFELHGHPKANRAYAWGHDTDDPKKQRHIAILHVPPIVSPLDAVRAAIVQEMRANEQA